MTKTIWKCTAPWRCSNCGATRPWTDDPPFWEHLVRVGKKTYGCDGPHNQGVWVSLEERNAIRAAYKLGGKAAAEATMVEVLRAKTHEGRRDFRGWFEEIAKEDLRQLLWPDPEDAVVASRPGVQWVNEP
jgi:hypothetical protein